MSDNELDELDKALQRESEQSNQELKSESQIGSQNAVQGHNEATNTQSENKTLDLDSSANANAPGPDSKPKTNSASEASSSDETSDSSSDDSDESDSDESDSDGSGSDKNEDDDAQLSDGESSEIPRTRNEIIDEEAPRLPADLVITDSTPLECVGTVKTVGDRAVVIMANNSARYRVLADGAVLVLQKADSTKVPIGVLYETFGPVDKPFYVVKFKEESELEPFKSSIGEQVFQVVSTSKYLRTEEFKSKGTDASNFNDEEVPLEEQEFSDDEQEMLAKTSKNKKRKKNKSKGDPKIEIKNQPASHNPSITPQPQIRPRPQAQQQVQQQVPQQSPPQMQPPPMQMSPEMMQQWYQFQQYQQYQQQMYQMAQMQFPQYQQPMQQPMQQQPPMQQPMQQQQQQQQQQQHTPPPPPPPY